MICWSKTKSQLEQERDRTLKLELAHYLCQSEKVDFWDCKGNKCLNRRKILDWKSKSFFWKKKIANWRKLFYQCFWLVNQKTKNLLYFIPSMLWLIQWKIESQKLSYENSFFREWFEQSILPWSQDMVLFIGACDKNRIRSMWEKKYLKKCLKRRRAVSKTAESSKMRHQNYTLIKLRLFFPRKKLLKIVRKAMIQMLWSMWQISLKLWRKARSKTMKKTRRKKKSFREKKKSKKKWAQKKMGVKKEFF